MKLDTPIQKITSKLAKAGFEAAIVGGAVRDLLSSNPVNDWDLTTNAKPEEILKLFPRAFYNNRFGTVGVPRESQESRQRGGQAKVRSQELPVQITTYRKEQSYSDKRHPDVIVWGKTLEEDLARRDFTINALALKYSPRRSSFDFAQDSPSRWPASQSPKANLASSGRGEPDGLLEGVVNFQLVDPFGGQKDLKEKIIRTVGDPDQRFSEDALRLLRAVRFAATLGFAIEKSTLSSITRNSSLIRSISGERIRDELFKILESENAADGIMLVKETGLLKEILSELEVCFGVEQKSPQRHHIYDVGTHCVEGLRNCPSPEVIVRFATLLHDIGKAQVAAITPEGVRTFYNHEVAGGRQVRDIAKRLNLSREDRERLFKLVRFHQFTVNEHQTDRALRRFIRNIGPENIEAMMDLRVGDRLGGGLQQPESWRLKLFRQRLKEVMKKPFTVADLKVSGHDVMQALNIKPGPKVGEVLNKLFEEVADDPKKNNREYLLNRIISLSTSAILPKEGRR